MVKKQFYDGGSRTASAPKNTGTNSGTGTCRRKVLFRVLLAVGIVVCLVEFAVHFLFGEARYRYILNSVARLSLLKDATGTTVTSSSYRYSTSEHSVLQAKAQQSVQDLLARRVFDTTVSSQQVVLQESFPMKWNSCILTSKSWQGTQPQPSGTTKPANTLNIALLGGSASALSPFHCFPPENPMAGRYSNILQEKLQETTSNWSRHDHDNHEAPSATIHFHVHNFAQGGTDSFDNALVVDHLMDPYNTDLIIREFSVNDGLNLDVPRRRGDVTGHLDLWMARVYSLFAAAGISPPPPLLLLHLWDYDEGKHLEEMKLSGHLRDQVLQRQWDVIRHYQSIMNWDIQVINVARGVNGTVVADNVEALLDDPLHPSCTANQLISSMVHYALLENIGAHCTSRSTLQQTSTPPQQQPTELQPFRPAERDPFLANPFFDAFVQGHLVARVASMSPELPHAPNVSNFNSQTMQSLALMDRLVVNSDREDYRRMDRKTFWRLPGCQEDNDKQPLQFTLHEPDLEYLAFRLTNMQRQMWFRITINNGISKDFTPDSPLSHQRFTVLWKIADILAASTRAQQYHLSFCSTIPNYGRLEGTKANGEARTERDIKQETTYLQFVVAVMRKP